MSQLGGVRKKNGFDAVKLGKNSIKSGKDGTMSWGGKMKESRMKKDTSLTPSKA